MGLLELIGMDAGGMDMGMDEIDELLGGVELGMPGWEAELPHACPFCGGRIGYEPQADPDVLAFRCSCGCGYNGYVMGPYAQRDKRYDTEFEKLADRIEAAIGEARESDPGWGVPADDGDEAGGRSE